MTIGARRLGVAMSVVALLTAVSASPAAADLEFGPAAQEEFGVAADGSSTGSGSGDLADAWTLFRATEEGRRIEESLASAGVVVDIEVLPARWVADGEAYGTSGITERDADGNVTHISIKIAGTETLGSTQVANTIHHEMRHAEEQMADNERHVHEGIDADVDPLMVEFQNQSDEVRAAEIAAQDDVDVVDEAGDDEVVFMDIIPSLDEYLATSLKGDAHFFAASGVDDVTDCNTNEPVDDPAADMIGLAGTIDETSGTATVVLRQSPLLSMQQYSWAVTLDLFAVSGRSTTLVQETHEDIVSVGERDEAGNVDPNGADVLLDPTSARFTFDSDPNDPWNVIIASIFSTPNAGDRLACDGAVAAAFPYAATSNETEVSGTCSPDGTTACLHHGRFSVELTGPSGPASPVVDDSDDTVRFEGADGAAVARILDGCVLNNQWWVSSVFGFDMYEMTVIDTATDEIRVYSQDPIASMPPAITDTSAFSVCAPMPFSPLSLFDGAAPFSLNERALYSADDYSILGDMLPPEFDEIQASAVMIQGVPFALWTGPRDYLDQMTVELDRFSSGIQNTNGIDLVGSAADALPYFGNSVRLEPLPSGEFMLMLPFPAAGAADTDLGIYFGTTLLGLEAGTFAAAGGRLPLEGIPEIDDGLSSLFAGFLAEGGRTIPDLLVLVTPFVVADEG
jgi:hypothetical protein